MNVIPGIEFSLADASAIAIIGGADGPTSIFLTAKLAPHLIGPIAIAAYSYMALIPIIQPPIMRLLTTKEERRIHMPEMRDVSRVEKLLFPAAGLLLCCFLAPASIPLLGPFFFGNLMKESGVVDRLAQTARTAIIDTASDVSGTLTMMVTIIGAVSLVVGAIGIANMMLVAVRERSREIGIRRAVGASRAAITGQFLVEAVVLSILGGLIGIAVGAVLAVGLSSTLLDLPAAVSEIAVVGALLVSVLVGIAAGIGPAWQAASVDPTVALRYE